ncbi:MAG: hypothetical protein WD512_13255 [Candidatus Paceibacterota bacterium]
MESLANLRKEKSKLLKYKRVDDERARLKADIFNLKHGNKIKAVRNVAVKLKGFAQGYGNKGKSKGKSKNPFGKGSVLNPRSIW